MERMKNEPPREWIEEHFVHGGRVKFCTACGAIPAVPMGSGHDCHHLGAEAYFHNLLGEWAEEPVDWFRVGVVENCDRPGDWMAVYDLNPTSTATEGAGDDDQG